MVNNFFTYSKASHLFQLVDILYVEGGVEEGQEWIHKLKLQTKTLT